MAIHANQHNTGSHTRTAGKTGHVGQLPGGSRTKGKHVMKHAPKQK